jgi:hypothetical protein
MYRLNSAFLTVGLLGFLEQINKEFEVPRKISNVPRNRWFNLRELPTAFVFCFLIHSSGFLCGKMFVKQWCVSDDNVCSCGDRSATFSGPS